MFLKITINGNRFPIIGIDIQHVRINFFEFIIICFVLLCFIVQGFYYKNEILWNSLMEEKKTPFAIWCEYDYDVINQQQRERRLMQM